MGPLKADQQAGDRTYKELCWLLVNCRLDDGLGSKAARSFCMWQVHFTYITPVNPKPRFPKKKKIWYKLWKQSGRDYTDLDYLAGLLLRVARFQTSYGTLDTTRKCLSSEHFGFLKSSWEGRTNIWALLVHVIKHHTICLSLASPKPFTRWWDTPGEPALQPGTACTPGETTPGWSPSLLLLEGRALFQTSYWTLDTTNTGILPTGRQSRVMTLSAWY